MKKSRGDGCRREGGRLPTRERSVPCLVGLIDVAGSQPKPLCKGRYHSQRHTLVGNDHIPSKRRLLSARAQETASTCPDDEQRWVSEAPPGSRRCTNSTIWWKVFYSNSNRYLKSRTRLPAPFAFSSYFVRGRDIGRCAVSPPSQRAKNPPEQSLLLDCPSPPACCCCCCPHTCCGVWSARRLVIRSSKTSNPTSSSATAGVRAGAAACGGLSTDDDDDDTEDKESTSSRSCSSCSSRSLLKVGGFGDSELYRATSLLVCSE